MFDVVRSTDGTSDWRLVGELDLVSAATLTEVLSAWLAAERGRRSIRLDASELTLLDSTGTRALYELTKPPRCAEVVLITPHEIVWRVLVIAGLADGDRLPAVVRLRYLP